MALAISNEEFTLLRDYIEEQCGISLTSGKEYLIESRLTNMVVESGSKSFLEFYRKIKTTPDQRLRDKLVDAMTTNETLWFRDKSPFTVFQDVLLPQFDAEIASGKRVRVRIWCAASSTGQEPYSLAMCVHEFARLRPGAALRPANVEILGTDISPSVLFLAMAGRYDQISMGRGLEDAMRDRYFKQNGRVWVLDDAVKKMVSYKRLNLQTDFASLGTFDIIMCRNVAIYFSETFKKNLFARLARALNAGGYLFLGSAESLSGYNTDFEIRDHQRSI
ncbi:MAG: protein-glutamate O-methyltransferase CheR, partial [Deltaproteobacteria bacterium]|nr:protein-glutamate O-methyltransferase CheR [Deltaproteobacteria bacterium]